MTSYDHMFSIRMGGCNPAIHTRAPRLDVVLDWSNVFDTTPATFRMRHGCSNPNFFSISEASNGGGAIVHSDVFHHGTAQFSNLVQDWLQADLHTPPSALALSLAYSNLYNMIISQQGSSNGVPVVYVPYAPFYLPFGTAYPVPTQLGPNAPTNAVQFGVVGCTSLYVAAGGTLYSPSYCNLIQDAHLTMYDNSTYMPPSASSLYDAYDTITTYINANMSAISSNLSTLSTDIADIRSNVTNNIQFKNDDWIVSELDQTPRLRFGTLGPTEFSTSHDPVLSNNAFVWWNGESNELMTLTHDGTLRPVGGYCNLPIANDVVRGVTYLLNTPPTGLTPDSNSAVSQASLLAAYNRVIERILAFQSFNLGLYTTTCNLVNNVADVTQTSLASNLQIVSSVLSNMDTVLELVDVHDVTLSNTSAMVESISNDATYASNQLPLIYSTIAFVASNAATNATAELASNALQPALFASNTVPPLSNMAAFSSNAVLPLSHMASFASNSVEPLSNMAAFSSNAVLPLSHMASFASNSVEPLSNTASFASNNVAPLSNMAAFASNNVAPLSNTASFASNNVAPLSDMAAYASNNVVPLSDMAAYASNNVVPLSDMASFASNNVVPTSNMASFASNNVVPTSNMASFASNIVVPLSNMASFASNNVVPTSNMASFASNTVVPLSNMASFASNNVEPLSNMASFASNNVEPMSNMAAFASNSVVPMSNMASFASNNVEPLSNMASFASNTVMPMSNMASFASNNVEPLSNMAAFASNQTPVLLAASTFGCNAAVYASNALVPVGAAAEHTSNALVALSNNVIQGALWTSNAISDIYDDVMFASNAMYTWNIPATTSTFNNILVKSNVDVLGSFTNDVRMSSNLMVSSNLFIAGDIFTTGQYGVGTENRSLLDQAWFASNMAIAASNEAYSTSKGTTSFYGIRITMDPFGADSVFENEDYPFPWLSNQHGVYVMSSLGVQGEPTADEQLVVHGGNMSLQYGRYKTMLYGRRAQLGIGTSNPNATLDVRGPVHVAGGTTTHGLRIGMSTVPIGYLGDTVSTPLPDWTADSLAAFSAYLVESYSGSNPTASAFLQMMSNLDRAAQTIAPGQTVASNTASTLDFCSNMVVGMFGDMVIPQNRYVYKVIDAMPAAMATTTSWYSNAFRIASARTEAEALYDGVLQFGESIVTNLPVSRIGTNQQDSIAASNGAVGISNNLSSLSSNASSLLVASNTWYTKASYTDALVPLSVGYVGVIASNAAEWGVSSNAVLDWPLLTGAFSAGLQTQLETKSNALASNLVTMQKTFDHANEMLGPWQLNSNGVCSMASLVVNDPRVSATSNVSDTGTAMEVVWTNVDGVSLLLTHDMVVLSDVTTKEDVLPVTDALSIVRRLNGYTYTTTSAPHRRHVGLVAQEVAEVLPDAVRVVRADGTLAIDYNAVLAVVLQAVKDLHGQRKI